MLKSSSAIDHDEDGRQILPPTILREQQRSTYTTCVEVAGRTLLRAQEAWRRERCRRKPPENSPASRPRSTSKASMASTKLVTTPHQPPLQSHPYYATAVARPSDATAGPDRDQRDPLCRLQWQGKQRCRGAPSSNSCGSAHAAAGDTDSQTTRVAFFRHYTGSEFNGQMSSEQGYFRSDGRKHAATRGGQKAL